MRDPLPALADNPQSLNRYPYVLNNPALYTDPYGLFSCGPLSGACHKAKSAAGEVVGGAVDYLSDPKHAVSVVRTTSGLVMAVTCPTGVAAVCGPSLAVYAVATGIDFYMADNNVDRAVIAGGGAFAICTAWLEGPASLAAVGAGEVADVAFAHSTPAQGAPASSAGNGAGAASCSNVVRGEK